MAIGLHNADRATPRRFTESEALQIAKEVAPAVRRRFWAKVERSGREACWLWQAARLGGNHRGGQYGQFAVTVAPGRQKHLYAHRVAWALSHGSLPEGMSVLHRCDVSLCVNPNHLFLGTHTDNMQDASRKGRLSVPRLSARKVTDDQIAEIFALRAEGWRQVRIAERFSVTESFISSVLRGRRRSIAAPRTLRKVG